MKVTLLLLKKKLFTASNELKTQFAKISSWSKLFGSGFDRYLESKKSEREAVYLEANQTFDPKKTRFLAD